MLDSKVWTVEIPQMGTFYIFEPLKAHTYEPNISLIMLITQNPEFTITDKRKVSTLTCTQESTLCLTEYSLYCGLIEVKVNSWNVIQPEGIPGHVSPYISPKSICSSRILLVSGIEAVKSILSKRLVRSSDIELLSSDIELDCIDGFRKSMLTLLLGSAGTSSKSSTESLELDGAFVVMSSGCMSNNVVMSNVVRENMTSENGLSVSVPTSSVG